MKRIRTLFTAVMLSLLLAVPSGCADGNHAEGTDSLTSYKDIPGVTEEEITAIEALTLQRGGFTYGHLLETEAFLLPDGSFAGFTIDLCGRLTDLFGVEFTPVCYSEQAEMKNALENQELDFSGGFSQSQEDFTSCYMTMPVAGRSLEIYVLKEEAITSAQELNGKKIGALDGSALLDEVTERYSGFSFTSVWFSNYDEGVALLEAGEIDGIIAVGSDHPVLSEYDTITSREFFTLAYYPVSISTAEPALAPLISVIDKYLEAGGDDEMIKLYEAGAFAYKRNCLYQSFTDEEVAYLDDMVSGGQKVNIGLQHDAYPASFYNEAEGEYQGVSIDILKEITVLTGLVFEPVSTSETTAIAVILEKLKSGEISMMTQLLKTESRKNDYIWSEVSYLTTNYALLSRIDYPQIENYQVPRERVGTINKTAHEVMFDTWFPNHQNRIVYDTTNEGFDALENGEIDLLMLSENMLLQQTNLRQKIGFKVNVKSDVTLDSFFGFSKEETILRSIVDKTMGFIAIETISDGWMNKVFDYQSEIARVRGNYFSYFLMAAVIALVAMLLMLLKNRRLGKSLMEQTATISTIYKSIPDTIFSKNTEGIYTSCNPSFERQAGLSEKEIIGKTYAEVFADRAAETVEQYIDIDKDVMSRQITSTVEEKVVFPDGSYRLLETLKAPLIQNGVVVGIIGMGRDVTERKEIKSRLDSVTSTAQNTQLSFQTVLDTLPMPVRIVDLESRRIVYVNKGMLELLEYDSPEEICGLLISDIVPEILSGGIVFAEQEELLMAESSRPITVDMEYLTKTGRIIEAVVAARIIDYKNRRSSIGIIKDLTEEKKTAQILRDLAEREKEANQAKSIFLANMSHEIRTPMNGIIGMTDLLLHENLAERQRQYTNDIKSSAELLLNIINDILDLSKITEGKLPIILVDIDLNMLLKNTVSMMRFSAQSKDLSFIDDIQIGTPEYVRVDDIRLNQIITNLLSNAIKFTKEGYVKLAAKIKDNCISFEISDTGIGIKEEELPLIFTAFEQADKRKNRAVKGTGLGLSIARNLVDLMGGRIWVESKYGTGSTFFVQIPYIPGDESAVEIKEEGFEYVFAPTAQILLVDDIQTNLTVGAGLLSLCGITADVALSGQEAVRLVKEKDYDIIFMDHMMPEMDGIETMEVIRALGGKYLKVPIIALTANAVRESRTFLISSGMDDFLSKPINKTELMNILRKWLPTDKIKSVTEDLVPGQQTLYSETLLAASKVDGIDIELALSRIGGLHKILEKSIRQTALMLDEKLKNMDACLAKGDLTGFAMDAHGLKGVLANIGAMKHAESAAALEIGAKAENTSLCMERFTTFASVMTEFAAGLKKCFPEAEPRERSPGDRGVLTERVLKAIDSLERFEAAEALESLKELAGFTFGTGTDDALDKAIRAAERFSYDEAIELLQTAYKN